MYKTNGWSAHSGAGPRYNKFWLAYYVDGVQTDYATTTAGNLVLFGTLKAAQTAAAKRPAP